MKEYQSEYKTWIKRYFAGHPDDLITAAGLYEAMKDDGLKINQATVYRNLARLVESGVIGEHKSNSHDEKYYQYLKPEHDCAHHLHLYCRKCGRVIHLEGELMAEISVKLDIEYGFLLDCRQSSLVGLCEKCRKEAQYESVH